MASLKDIFKDAFTGAAIGVSNKDERKDLIERINKQKEESRKKALVEGIRDGNPQVLDKLSKFEESNKQLNRLGFKMTGDPFSNKLDIAPLTQEEKRSLDIRNELARGKSPEAIFPFLTAEESEKFLPLGAVEKGKEKIAKEKVLSRLNLPTRQFVKEQQALGKNIIPGPDGGIVAGFTEEQVFEFGPLLESRIKKETIKELAAKGLAIDPTKKDFTLKETRKPIDLEKIVSEAIEVGLHPTELQGKNEEEMLFTAREKIAEAGREKREIEKIKAVDIPREKLAFEYEKAFLDYEQEKKKISLKELEIKNEQRKPARDLVHQAIIKAGADPELFSGLDDSLAATKALSILAQDAQFKKELEKRKFMQLPAATVDKVKDAERALADLDVVKKILETRSHKSLISVKKAPLLNLGDTEAQQFDFHMKQVMDIVRRDLTGAAINQTEEAFYEESANIVFSDTKEMVIDKLATLGFLFTIAKQRLMQGRSLPEEGTIGQDIKNVIKKYDPSTNLEIQYFNPDNKNYYNIPKDEVEDFEKLFPSARRV